MPSEREAKLPKWAQDELERLRRELATAKRDRAEAFSRHPGTDVLRHDGTDYCDLPPGSTIRFVVGEHFADWVDVRVREEAGEKLVDICGGDLFQVLPRAANAIRIRVKR